MVTQIYLFIVTPFVYWDPTKYMGINMTYGMQGTCFLNGKKTQNKTVWGQIFINMPKAGVGNRKLPFCNWLLTFVSRNGENLEKQRKEVASAEM